MSSKQMHAGAIRQTGSIQNTCFFLMPFLPFKLCKENPLQQPAQITTVKQGKVKWFVVSRHVDHCCVLKGRHCALNTISGFSGTSFLGSRKAKKQEHSHVVSKEWLQRSVPTYPRGRLAAPADMSFHTADNCRE